MALPTSSDILTMDYNFQGFPYVNLPSKSTINLLTMDYNFWGFPFVSNSAAVIGNIKSIAGIQRASIKSVSGIDFSSVKSAGGIVD